MVTKKQILFLMFFAVVLVSFSFVSAAGWVIYNLTSYSNATGDFSSSTPFSTLFSNATGLGVAAGDVVNVTANFSYSEKFYISVENVTIWGDGASVTVISNGTNSTGTANSSLILNITAKNVTINGLTFMGPTGQGSPSNGSLIWVRGDAVTIKNSVFNYSADDMIKIDSNINVGHNITSATIENNTFSNLNNSGKAAIHIAAWNGTIGDITINLNTFHNITGVPINLTANATHELKNVIIDNNTINATMSLHGITLYNVTSVNITDNIIYNSTGNGINIESIWGSGGYPFRIKIDNNNITYSQKFGIEFCSHGSARGGNITVGVANITNQIIRNNSFIANKVGGANNTCIGANHTNINVSFNFWGNKTGPLSPISPNDAAYTAINIYGSGNYGDRGSNVSTNVTYLPYYKDTALTKLSANLITYLNATELNITHSGMSVVFNSTPENSSVLTVPINIENVSIDLSSTLNVSNHAALSAAINITANASSSDGVVKIQIPQNVNISGNATWNGLLYLPTSYPAGIITNADIESAGYVNTGYDASVALVVEIGGANNISLNFTRGVRILIQGEAGKQVVYQGSSPSTVAISLACSSDTQAVGDALAAGTSCSMDSGNDKVIWTKHFTRFITYSQVAEATTTTTSSSTGGGTTPVPFWTGGVTYVVSSDQFSEGVSRVLAVKDRVKVSVNGGTHYVGVRSVTANSATIEISSDPVEVTLDVGEEAKRDVTNDGYYDIYVMLNSIANSKADMTIRKIYEKVPEEVEGPAETTGKIVTPPEEAERDLTLVWVIVIVLIIVAVIGVAVAYKKRR